MKIVATALLMLAINLVHAQTNAIFDYQIGAEIHRENYNGKGKLESHSIEKILRCDTTSEGLLYVMNIRKYSPDGKELWNGEGSLKCDKGVILIDMESIYHMEDNGAYQWRTESEYLQIPGIMNDGQTLPDAKVVCTVIKQPRVKVGPAGSIHKSDMGAKVIYAIKNRRVSSNKVTTPAGEFSAYKVTSEVTNESDVGYGYKVESITNEWYVQGVGLVKSEILNRRGKLLSYSMMTKRTQ
ncbi:MAG TPA: hypothetical protein VK658_18745 [Chryseolinea sp.]|nr:hypothetical protein [Chryseolinea sp.]